MGLEVETKEKNEEIARLASKCAETPPELVQLKQEADDMRHGHKRDLERAEARATYAEKESNTVRATHEKRVVNLESRLQELSETVGTYDRIRNQDQLSIQKLKERFTNLKRKSQHFCSLRILVHHLLEVVLREKIPVQLTRWIKMATKL